MKKLTAQFTNVGNPDFGQFAPLSGSKKVEGDSIKALVNLAFEYQSEWNLGSGNWVDPVIYETTESDERRVIGTMSYNGRVWNGDEEVTDVEAR